MAKLELSERDLDLLRMCSTAAIEGRCIPEWEFDALFGCSRSRAKRSVDAAIRRIETRGERPSEPACERLVLLLSALRGASDGLNTDELEALIERLTAIEDTRSARSSGVALRADAPRAALAQRR